MTKNIITLVLLITYEISTVSAQKHDAMWLVGHDAAYAQDDSFCISILDFSSNSLQVLSNGEAPVFFQETNVSLCDANGNLLMYSNGVHIFNRYHEIMENGSWLVPSIDVPLESYNIPQGALLFYVPGSNDRLILIHPQRDYVEQPLWTTAITKLYYSIIDLNASGGKGKVIQKKNTFLIDTLDYGKLTAVKHGNGRDWWILANEANSNRFYKILLNDKGPHIYNKQTIGPVMPYSLGQAVFSPNGEIYATVGGVDDVKGNFLNVYDFDRCTGILSNPRQLNWHSEGDAIGMAISPNSRYLYVSTSKIVNQYDLLAPDLATSRKIVAIYDGYQSPFGSKFYLAQLGPDNKIYINCSNGETVMHVIENPDKPGIQCNVKQHNIQLPCYNAYSIPNNPNYRLYDLPGSSCDTLGISLNTQKLSREKFVIEVYPNPATEKVYLKLPNNFPSEIKIRLVNIAGGVMEIANILQDGEILALPLEDCQPGIYFVQVLNDGQVVDTQKLIIIR